MYPSSVFFSSVSMIAIPQSILPLTPFHSAAAVCAEWKRILHPISSSRDSVAKEQPSFSSSRHAFGYSAMRLLSITIAVRSSSSVPVTSTKPSNIERPASTSTVLAPQAQPISSPLMPSGSATPRLTEPSEILPS